MRRWLLPIFFIGFLGVGAFAWWQFTQLTVAPELTPLAKADTQRGDDAAMGKHEIEAVEAYKQALSEDSRAYHAAQMLVEVTRNLPTERESLRSAHQSNPDDTSAWHLFLCYDFIERGRSENFYLAEAVKELDKARLGLTSGAACAPLQEARQELLRALDTGVSEGMAREVRNDLGRDPLLLPNVVRWLGLAGVVVLGALGMRRGAGAALRGFFQALARLLGFLFGIPGRVLRRILGLIRPRIEVVRRGLPNDPPPVRSINQYNLQRINDGGLKIIYKGINPHDKQTYAIAELQHRYLSDPDVVAHFRQGVVALLKLQATRVVATYEFRCEEGRYYSIMEYLDGESLRALMDRSKRIPWVEAYRIFREMLDALKVVHAQGIIHRDVKPDNFQKREDIFKLLDFDTVLVPSASRLTRVRGGGVGTPDYMAPEQQSGGTIAFYTDIYALSVVFFEMLTGHLPNAPGPHAGNPKAALEDPALGLPKLLPSVILMGMDADPAHRFQCIEPAFLNALEGAVKQVNEAVGSGSAN